MSIDERLNLERDDRRHEGTQARLGGRRKFACCRQCGTADGMQSVRRETLIHLKMATVVLELAPWFSESGNVEYLFYICPHCNSMHHVPDGYEEMLFTDILNWLSDYNDADSVQPDHAALALSAEQQAGAEPELASLDSRAAAGLEG